jgi:hypothetical protein
MRQNADIPDALSALLQGNKFLGANHRHRFGGPGKAVNVFWIALTSACFSKFFPASFEGQYPVATSVSKRI